MWFRNALRTLPAMNRLTVVRQLSTATAAIQTAIPTTNNSFNVISSGNKVHFKSLGCPRNWVDSEVMLGILLSSGYEPTDQMTEADYLVVNTCGFLKIARDESNEAIEEIINNKKKNSKLVVTGCMINLYKDQIKENYPEIDYVLGSGAIDKVINAISSEGKGEIMTSSRSYLENGEVPRMLATPRHYAYLKIAEGCRKRCSFCIIPKIKGRLRSKPQDQVVEEFKALLKSNVNEVILIAQDLGDFGKDRKDKNGLASLLNAILNSTDDRFWLRLLYLYPDEITPEIIEIIKSDSRICKYLDMPIQHINNTILKSMKRKTSGDDIKATIKMLRQEIPGIYIRTSLMVGFPGETDEQFNELLEFVKESKLENVGVFKYSDETEAWSSRLENKVPENIKEHRYQELMLAQFENVQQKAAKMIAEKTRLDVVVEGFHPESRELLVGRYFGQAPEIDNKIIIDEWGQDEGKVDPIFGNIYRVEINELCGYDLVGQLIH